MKIKGKKLIAVIKERKKIKMKIKGKKLIAVVGLIMGVMLMLSSAITGMAAGGIDNSSLVPKYVPDSQVKLENGSPDWVKTLVMAEIRIETATEEGTFQSAVKVLDHYAEMGVNGIWVNPVYADDAHYGVKYPDRISSKLTGTTDIEKGFAVAKAFVDEAHKRNIRIFFDIVTWGTPKDSPIVTEHPDWYDGWREAYGGYVWRWSNTEWQEWFTQNAVMIVEKTGIDGFRCDLEPDNSGYGVFSEVRKRLYEKGHKIAIFSEVVNLRYGPNGLTYDFEQMGVGSDETCQYHWQAYSNYFLEKGNIVDCIKTGTGIGEKLLQSTGEGGTFRFYTFEVTSHDSPNPVVRGNRVTIGYQAILAPFIPMWFIGEEWNNPKKLYDGSGALFYNTINWSKLEEPENKAFYEDVKKMIRIRRQHPEIYENYPEDHQDTNICKVKVRGIESIEAYALYNGDTGILVVPNANVHNTQGDFTITVPLADMGMSGYKNFTVTELMTDKSVVSGTAAQISQFDFNVPSQHVRVFLVKGKGGTGATSSAVTSSTKPGKTSSSAATSAAVTSANANVTPSAVSETADPTESTNETESTATETPSADQSDAVTSEEAESTETITSSAVDGGDGTQGGIPVWVWIAGGGAVLIAAAVIVLLATRRKAA